MDKGQLFNYFLKLNQMNPANMKKYLLTLGISIIFPCILLNCSGKKVGTSTNDESVETSSSSVIAEPAPGQDGISFNMKLWQEGIDFYARGNEPSWSVDIDFDSKLTFKPMDGPSFELTEYSIHYAQDANILRIAGRGDSGELIVTISGDPCVDTMSGEEFRNTVNVEIRSGDDADFRSMNGCGLYVPDFRLNDIWVLKSLNGIELKADRFPDKGAPTFEFHVEEGRVAGHAGCNNFNGSFFRSRNDILHFEPFAMTRMMCPDMEIEDLVAREVAGRSMKYSIDGLILILIGFDGTELVFQKVD